MKKEIIKNRFKYVIEFIGEYEDLSYSYNKNGEDIEVIDYDRGIRTIINLAYQGHCWVNYCAKKMSIFNNKGQYGN